MTSYPIHCSRKRNTGRAAFIMLAVLMTLVITSVTRASQMDADDEAESRSPQAMAAIMDRIAPALVRVEYTFRYDKGEPPTSSHSHGSYRSSIDQERPHTEAGYLIAPDLVVSDDLMVHPRFVQEIHVRLGDDVQSGTIESVGVEDRACLIRLKSPLTSARPLHFAAKPDAKSLFVISQSRSNGLWTTHIRPFSRSVLDLENGERFCSVDGTGVVVTADAEPVGLTMNGELPLDDSWQGSPTDWNWIRTDVKQEALTRLEKQWSRGIVRVNLRFRSPKKDTDSGGYSSYYGLGDSGDETTEWSGPGLIFRPDSVLIPASFRPKTTARLERITVHLRNPDGTEDEKTASFSGSLKDYGALIATLDEPVSVDAVIEPDSATDIHQYRDTFLLSDKVVIRGETRVDYYTHGRFGGFDCGWRGLVFPSSTYGSEGDLYYFNRETGNLIAFPLSRRQRASRSGSRYSYWDDYDYYDSDALIMPVAYMTGIFAEPTAFFDESNVPLSEEEENRLAWLGVELQSLDQELARYNNVTEETRDGEIGGIVTYIYDGSPAAEAGIKIGDILLRMHFEDLPKPIDISPDEDSMYGMGGFPWDQLDQVPAEYFDQIPMPWSSAENTINRTLTDLGFGTPFTLDLVRDGRKTSIDLEVTEGPAHYGSAPKVNDEDLGFTVRDLTYEVRRYFLKKADDPGVIISKVDPGSKAAVAGLFPYEIITAVNDQEVHNVDEFKELVEGQNDLRLSVLRMTRARIVKISR